MHRTPSARVVLVCALTALGACRTMDPVVPYDSGRHDAGRDAPVDAPHADDVPVGDDVVALDAVRTDVVATDTPAPSDAVTLDTARADVPVGTDVVSEDTAPMPDAAPTNACIAAGGTCVPVVPGACPGGTTGGPSCGPGVGVTCCMTAPDAGGPVACTSVGGSCVALTPTACPAPRTVGDARMYTCGSGIGLECCLPAPDAGVGGAAPVCGHEGTATEGWYTASGTLICTDACTGLTPMCQHIGTTSAGWYTTSGHGCPPYSTLIVHDSTCM